MNELARFSPDDLDRLQERPSVIKRLRDHHHLVARLIAEGRRTTDVAAETGMSISRVSILKGDPAFRELIEMYRMNVEQVREAVFADTVTKAKLLLDNALDWKNDRYFDCPEEITPSEALADAEFAQAAVHGKLSKNINTNINVDYAGQMQKRLIHLETTNARNQEEMEKERNGNL